jgi:hypothetical protein
MTRGKYDRSKEVGISKIQSDILNQLTLKPTPISVVMKNLKIETTFSNKVSMTRSFSRLRSRGLIKSLGRSSNREHLWVKIKNVE